LAEIVWITRIEDVLDTKHNTAASLVAVI
jgi:hypothetical protein